MKKYGCASLDELRRIPAERLVGEQETQHHITVDGHVLTDTPNLLRLEGIHNEEAMLHGFNAEESGPFILFSHADLKNYEGKVRLWAGEYADEVLALYRPATDEEADRFWAGIYGAVFFSYPHHCLSRLEKANGVPSWEYLFTKDNGRLGCWHSGELVYAFGVIPEGSSLYSAEDRQLSDVMHGCWADFIRTGDPGLASLSGCGPAEEIGTLTEFGTRVRTVTDPYLPLYDILDRMYGWPSSGV